MGRVEGKVAMITGAARGQGRSHAVRLAQEGADIVAIDICGSVPTAPYELGTAVDLEQTADAVRALGRRVATHAVDVRDYPALKAAVDHSVEEFGHLDIVIANAGIVSFGAMVDMSEETWQDMIDINLTGAWHTCKAAIPRLTDGGAIVITSSIAGLTGFANVGHYVAAKHGLVGLMRTLASELAPRFIRVNTVHPTEVDTPMIQNDAHYRLFRPDLATPDRDDFAEAAEALHLLPVRWLDPVDVSNAVLFLVSDEARYITGVSLPIDAGMTQK
jgi:SDR family mycofactocin-dependent oxidoreductase